jgi:hypothetical protein
MGRAARHYRDKVMAGEMAFEEFEKAQGELSSIFFCDLAN